VEQNSKEVFPLNQCTFQLVVLPLCLMVMEGPDVATTSVAIISWSTLLAIKTPIYSILQRQKLLTSAPRGTSKSLYD